MTDLEAAVFEARALNRLGALDDQVIKDVAFDYNVPEADLRDELDKPE